MLNPKVKSLIKYFPQINKLEKDIELLKVDEKDTELENIEKDLKGYQSQIHHAEFPNEQEKQEDEELKAEESKV